jgi:DNA-binding HxlR family transcriptional regulator
MVVTPSRERRADTRCSIARSLEVLGERWTLLILREAVNGSTRFSEFREALGVASDVLTGRLATLVEAGVLDKRPYREASSRTRYSYHLTDSGAELKVILGALQQWGDTRLPHPQGPSARRQSERSGSHLRVAFVDDSDAAVPLDDVSFVPVGQQSDVQQTAAYSRDGVG